MTNDLNLLSRTQELPQRATRRSIPPPGPKAFYPWRPKEGHAVWKDRMQLNVYRQVDDRTDPVQAELNRLIISLRSVFLPLSKYELMQVSGRWA